MRKQGEAAVMVDDTVLANNEAFTAYLLQLLTDIEQAPGHGLRWVPHIMDRRGQCIPGCPRCHAEAEGADE